ncbi:MAG: hypothetical protein U9N30_02310 [Campylobacterota bacterium]|nr:hypothetical protein [Campylobacterota bacterium]
MKKHIQKIKSANAEQILLAIANGYEAIIVSYDYDDSQNTHCFNNIDDLDYVYSVTQDYGWDTFILIDLIKNTETLINIDDLEAA